MSTAAEPIAGEERKRPEKCGICDTPTPHTFEVHGVNGVYEIVWCLSCGSIWDSREDKWLMPGLLTLNPKWVLDKKLAYHTAFCDVVTGADPGSQTQAYQAGWRVGLKALQDSGVPQSNLTVPTASMTPCEHCKHRFAFHDLDGNCTHPGCQVVNKCKGYKPSTPKEEEG